LPPAQKSTDDLHFDLLYPNAPQVNTGRRPREAIPVAGLAGNVPRADGAMENLRGKLGNFSHRRMEISSKPEQDIAFLALNQSGARNYLKSGLAGPPEEVSVQSWRFQDL